jgi:hypothetical protein
MSNAKIGGTANQVHTRVQGTEASCRVPTFASQTGGEPLSERAIQAFNKSRSEDCSSTRKEKQLLSPLQHPVSHRARNLDHPLFLASLDHRSNVKVFPDL